MTRNFRDYSLRKHLTTLASANKPEAVAERVLAREANKRALADCRNHFPTLTVDNFEAADAYRLKRVSFWTTKIATKTVREG